VTHKKKTTITFETERLLVISGPRSRALNWCPRCNQLVRSVTTEDAAILADVSLAVICREVDADRLHAMPTADGAPLICLNSIMQMK
jgi:hypothetical protein